MAYDAFLKLEGIAGESQKKDHIGEIQIDNFSLGASNPTTVTQGSGLGASKVALADFAVMKPTDKASPILFLKCCSGQHFPTASVALQKATGGPTGEVYLRYDFKKVFVSSIQWAGNNGVSDTPLESISFSFEEMKITYKPQGSDGSLKSQVIAGWNQSANAKV
jgi:type VI secretion system secreted protein Hcp